tara:strand:+ start:101 stop:1573 length:1473 start_codon:yes stop_codon:yes gene_type:complete
MPRQLKVIAPNVVLNAPFRVNWTTPVIIKPGNKITMDKFVAVIPDITANFELPQSTYTVYLSQDAVNYASFEVTLVANRYASISILLNAMSIQTNNGFAGYVTDMLPTGAGGKFNWYRDAGLKMQYVSDDSKMLFQYVTCPRNNLSLSAINMNTNVDSQFYPSSTAPWSIQQIITADVLCRGGGLLARIPSIKFPTVIQAVGDESVFTMGLLGNDNTFRGIGQSDNGDCFLRSNAGVDTVIPSNNFLSTITRQGMDFYQSGGYFQVRIYANPTNDTGSNTSYFDSVRDGFETALGPVSYTSAYNFFASGEKNAITHQKPLIGNVLNMTVDIAFNVPPSPLSNLRTCALDFSDASTLRSGLDVPNGRLICTPQLSAFGSYTASNTINMALINTFSDIALEIIDIPLETYQADTSGFPGSRKNIVAYFRPELTQVGSNTYRFDVNIFDWLDIPITYDLNLTSCSFRLINPNNNTDLKFSSCSFNLLINDKEY